MRNEAAVAATTPTTRPSGESKMKSCVIWRAIFFCGTMLRRFGSKQCVTDCYAPETSGVITFTYLLYGMPALLSKKCGGNNVVQWVCAVGGSRAVVAVVR